MIVDGSLAVCLLDIPNADYLPLGDRLATAQKNAVVSRKHPDTFRGCGSSSLHTR